MKQEAAYHYQIVARVMADLAEAGGGGPAMAARSLDEVARSVGMSAAHFQRLFSTWAGVSPKRFQQYLSLDLARHLLRQRRTLLDVADAAGLSGSGRLHDLFIRWEAMSPGDYAKAGVGLVIREGRFDSPYGPLIAMATEHGLCGLGFIAERPEDEVRHEMRVRWPEAEFRSDPQSLAPLIDAAFGGGAAKLHIRGGPFQIKVWEALLQIPQGRVSTYGDLAVRIGHPGAARAVGSAIGENPVGLLIPCHRVIRASGGPGGYRWGPGVKRAILLREALREDEKADIVNAQ